MSGAILKVRTDPRCALGDTDRLGPFVKVGNGDILTVGDNETFTSRDGGATWSPPRRMYRGRGRHRPCGGGLLARTRRGRLVYVYMDMSDYHWSWNAKRREAAGTTRLDVWAIRSDDDGWSWKAPERIFAGYCGALINMIETPSGELVVPIQRLVRDPCRHAICVYVSSDGGDTWEPSNVIDLGGHGHHDGAMEPAIVQLRDGRLWMLIRTNLDQFWNAFSADAGHSWRVLHPSGIDASSAPGALLRLASGRLVLVWNRLCAAGKKKPPRRGGDGQFSLSAASWHREEVSIAFSEDDGRTWSAPQVILQVKGAGPSYPYLFEPEPGRLWVHTLFGYRAALRIDERDFTGRRRASSR
jgi:sialidase-1